MKKSPRCLFESNIKQFLNENRESLLGVLCDNYHGDIQDGKWRFYKFNGKTEWRELIDSSESNRERIQYMLNAYRVLLTRARSGMVIAFPKETINARQADFLKTALAFPNSTTTLSIT